MKTVRELCLASGGENRRTPEVLARMERALAEDQVASSPWYLKLLVAIGAWLASLFFLGFVGSLIALTLKTRSAIGVIGCVVLVTAVLLGRKKLGLFAEQCALAASIAGQLMIYVGFLPERGSLGEAASLSIVLAVALYALYPSFLSRLITCLAALQLAVFWLWDKAIPGDAFWALHLALAGGCLARATRTSRFSALGYAVVLSMVAWQLESLWKTYFPASGHIESVSFSFWQLIGNNAQLSVALFALTAWASGGAKTVRANPPVFAGLAIALIGLFWFGNTGILLALFLAVLGFVVQNRLLLGFGLAVLPVYLVHYYYSLEITLLQKSGVLLASGFALLALREVLKRWGFLKEAEVVQ